MPPPVPSLVGADLPPGYPVPAGRLAVAPAAVRPSLLADRERFEADADEERMRVLTELEQREREFRAPAMIHNMARVDDLLRSMRHSEILRLPESYYAAVVAESRYLLSNWVRGDARTAVERHWSDAEAVEAVGRRLRAYVMHDSSPMDLQFMFDQDTAWALHARTEADTAALVKASTLRNPASRWWRHRKVRQRQRALEEARTDERKARAVHFRKTGEFAYELPGRASVHNWYSLGGIVFVEGFKARVKLLRMNTGELYGVWYEDNIDPDTGAKATALPFDAEPGAPEEELPPNHYIRRLVFDYKGEVGAPP